MTYSVVCRAGSCDHNKYLLRYLSSLGRLRASEASVKRAASAESDSEAESEAGSEAEI